MHNLQQLGKWLKALAIVILILSILLLALVIFFVLVTADNGSATGYISIYL